MPLNWKSYHLKIWIEDKLCLILMKKLLPFQKLMNFGKSDFQRTDKDVVKYVSNLSQAKKRWFL